MDWHHFHFYSRVLAGCLKPDSSFSQQAADTVCRYQKASLYVQHNEHALSQHPIMEVIAELPYEKQIAACTMLGKLNFSFPTKFIDDVKAQRNYLMLLFAVFVGVVCIMKLYVAPSFVAISAVADVTSSPLYQWFNDSVLFIIALISIGLLLVFRLQWIASSLERVSSLNAFDCLLLGNKCVNSYQLCEAIRFSSTGLLINKHGQSINTLTAQLTKDNIAITPELQHLFDRHVGIMTKAVNRRLRYIISGISVILTCAIALFIYAYYQPIFSLGELFL